MWVTEDTACGTATPQSLMLSTPQTDSVPASGCFPPDPQILGAALPLAPPSRQAPTGGVGERGVRGAAGAVGRQRHSFPAGLLAAAALPHVQVAAVALWGAKHGSSEGK